MGLHTYTDEGGPPEEHMLGQFIPLHYHFNMLQDEARVEAFRTAIETAVTPGMKVVELGGGTGILSYFAARKGARVWCVERNPELVRTSRRLLAKNGVAGRVQVVQADAHGFVPPEPVQLVICEMLHVGMLREKQLDVLASFKERYRQAFDAELPRFLPDSALLAVQPVEQSFDFSGYQAPVPIFQSPGAAHAGTRPLANLNPYANLYYDDDFPRRFGWSDDVTITQSGRANALRFITQNLLACQPDPQSAITWPNQFLVLPLCEPIPVQSGQRLHVAFDYRAGDPLSSLSDSISAELRGESSGARRVA